MVTITNRHLDSYSGLALTSVNAKSWLNYHHDNFDSILTQNFGLNLYKE